MALALLSTAHVGASCSDLARSLAFYRDLVGLTPLSHGARGAGHRLHDARGAAGPAIELLACGEPHPLRPPTAANQLGLYRVCLAHPDLDALHARLAAAGVRTGSPPVEMPLDRASGLAVRFFCAFDPDGACVEFIEQPEVARSGARLLHVNVNCGDLDRSSEWYQRVLGMAPLLARSQPGPVDGEGLGFTGSCRFRADFLAIPGRPDLVVDLLEWLDPAPTGRPAAAANQLGWLRLAFLVDDARAACAELDRLGVAHSGRCRLDVDPDFATDGRHAVFFRDPDGACLELVERPLVR